jgi:hypothetical protein
MLRKYNVTPRGRWQAVLHSQNLFMRCIQRLCCKEFVATTQGLKLAFLIDEPLVHSTRGVAKSHYISKKDVVSSIKLPSRQSNYWSLPPIRRYSTWWSGCVSVTRGAATAWGGEMGSKAITSGACYIGIWVYLRLSVEGIAGRHPVAKDMWNGGWGRCLGSEACCRF